MGVLKTRTVEIFEDKTLIHFLQRVVPAVAIVIAKTIFKLSTALSLKNQLQLLLTFQHKTVLYLT